MSGAEESLVLKKEIPPLVSTLGRDDTGTVICKFVTDSLIRGLFSICIIITHIFQFIQGFGERSELIFFRFA